MSLRIRRGTDAQRQAIAFDQGEVVYTTDTKKVYVGDGVTTGGVNILANSAGQGVTFNATTQAFDFSTNNLGLTTSAVSEGANKYFTTQRAQDAAAALFTAVGSPATTGTIAGAVATGTVTLSATPSPLLEQGEKFTVIGTGGAGLTAGGTYFVISNTGTSVVLADSLANAMTSTAITTLSTASLTGTTFSSAGISTGITFTYDSVTHTLTANSTGLTSLVTDTSPSLGGNLTLNSRNIVGTGNIGTTGNAVFTGTITATTGLGANLPLNTFGITGTGSINITGDITATRLFGNLTTAGNASIINSSTRAATLSRIILDTNGSITTPAILFDTASATFVTNTVSSSAPFINFYTATSSGTPTGAIALVRSRGTTISPSAVANGDQVGSIVTTAFSGSAFTASTEIISVIEGTVSAGVVPSRMDFKVTNSAGVTATSISIKPAQVDFAVPPKLPVIANDTARSSTITAPATGMLIFMTNGTSPVAANKVQVYDGTAWVNLN
jgi:hypothetical protein